MPIVQHITFHGIGPVPRELAPGEDRYWIDLDRYRSILDLLVGRDGVRISFDDGNLSDIQLGLPELEQRRLRASFFICAGRLGVPFFLGQTDLAQLVAAGMSVGSHGWDHRPWRGLSPSDAQREWAEAPARIRDVTKRPVNVAACPFGSYDRRVLRGLREAGFEHVLTSDPGMARESAFLQPRTSVQRDTTPAQVGTWLAARSLPQRLVDRARVLAKSCR